MVMMWSWAALLSWPLAIGGLVYAGVQANSRFQSNRDGFVCPITGEELPCPKCCPWK
jgi:hypothetical protein